jgi:CRISPR-associated protein Cas2
MNYLVSYDISDSRMRLKTSKILDDFGDRVQESVFELPDINDDLWAKCLGRLEHEIELENDDSIRIYPLCEACRMKIMLLGDGVKPMDTPDSYVI